ncbi:DUF3006 domain-containing protein [Paenibacillus sp. VCA1]|uniref:DUF3006 domain-containing protein n=1 Tax=Paenibacillus sp. VCA1 TaxID=3039148 RepID=UPI00287252CF|nr:DUF3006 domain-containing protein [Paenibacillus sp. VCA1]MDR9852678.1 DUF3006 domain-containing protein [Paenibacillus sp. VCA1]
MKGTIGIIEGFEGEFCKIEIDGNVEAVSKLKVDASAKRGDVVEWNGGKWIPNPSLTKKRTKEIKTLMDDVWED